MFWRRKKQEIRAEVEAARRADDQSRSTLDDARDTYRATLRTARAAEQTNRRNHFSERLTEAFGGT